MIVLSVKALCGEPPPAFRSTGLGGIEGSVIGLYPWSGLPGDAVRAMDWQVGFNPLTRNHARTMPNNFAVINDPHGFFGTRGISAQAFNTALGQANAGLSNVFALAGAAGVNLIGGSQGVPTAAFGGFTQTPAFTGAMDQYFSQSVQPVLWTLAGVGNTSSPFNFGTQFLFQTMQSPWLGNIFPRSGFPFVSGGPAPGVLPMFAFGSGLSGRLARPEDIQARWRRIGEQQIRQVYLDEKLTRLRVEYYQWRLFLEYADPWYLFLDRELDLLLANLLYSRPSYNAFMALSREVAAYTASGSPGDAVLLLRYQNRIRLVQLSRQLRDELTMALLADIRLAGHAVELQALLDYLRREHDENERYREWAADWSTRWVNAFVAAMQAPGLYNQTRDFHSNFPQISEIRELAAEVTDLTELLERSNTFSGRVRDSAGAIALALNDPRGLQAANNAHFRYIQEASRVLASTSYSIEMERYWSRLNGLVLSDPGLASLSRVEYPIIESLLSVQSKVHEQVAACLRQFGANCDPRRYGTISAILGSEEVFDWLRVAGAFQELYRRSRYQLHQSQAAGELERETLSRIGTSLNPVIGAIEAARGRFAAEIRAIAPLSQLTRVRLDLAASLRRDIPEIRRRLDRIELLGRELW